MNSHSDIAAAERRPASPVKIIGAVFAIAIVGTVPAVAGFVAALRYIRAHHLGAGWVIGTTLVYAAAILAVTLIANLIGRRLARVAPRPAASRYQRRFFAAMSLYALTLTASISVYAYMHPPQALVWVLAIAPALPLLGAIAAMGLYYREETDELERSIASQSVLWATGGLLAIATVWGFLEQFGLVAHVPAWAAFPVWAACLGAASALVRRRYQ